MDLIGTQRDGPQPFAKIIQHLGEQETTATRLTFFFDLGFGCLRRLWTASTGGPFSVASGSASSSPASPPLHPVS
jgi:hypothetical protein